MKIDYAYRNLGLKKLLYIEIFTHIKNFNNKKYATTLSVKNKFHISSLYFTAISLFFVFFQWIRSFISKVKLIMRGLSPRSRENND